MGELRGNPKSDFENPYIGSYVTFEGPDLAGKTTLIKSLHEKLQDVGYAWIRTVQPSPSGVNAFGDLARSMYQHANQFTSHKAARICLFSPELASLAVSAGAMQYLDKFILLLRPYSLGQKIDESRFRMLLQLAMLLDRQWHYTHVLIPALSKGQQVMSDRSLVSGLAYFVAQGGKFEELLEAHVRVLGNNFFVPNKVFYLGLSPEEFQKRKEASGREEYFENNQKFLQVQAAYEQVLGWFPVVERVDANRTPGAILHDVLGKFLPSRA